MIETSYRQRTGLKRFLEKHLSGDSISYRKIFAIFLPVLIDQAFVFGLNILNTAMISSSGVAAISAVSMVDSLNIFLISVFIALSTGGTVVVAQYKGQDNNKMVSRAAAGNITAVFLFALVITVIAVVFHVPTLSLLFGGAAADVFSNAKIYLIGSCISYCGIATMEAVCGSLRGVGETKSSLALSFFMNFSYVALNFLFINILHMGVFGMVISLNISRYAAGIISIIYLTVADTPVHFKIRDSLQFDWSILKRIFFIGLPFAAEQMFFNGGKILTQTFIVSLGTFAMAINAISGSLAGLFQITGNSLSITLITVVGQCMGRRNINDARKFTRSFVIMSSASFIIVTAIVLGLFNPLVSLYHPPKEIVHSIFIITAMNSVFQILIWSISFMIPSALRAAGDSKFTSVTSMLSMWLVRVVLGYILAIKTPLGVIGVWLAMDLEWGVRGTVFLLRLRGNKWHQHRVID